MSVFAETTRPASVTRLPSWTELNKQWLVAAIGRLSERIEACATGKGAPSETAPVDLDAAGFTPALLHCARAFGLSCFERELLLLVVGLELDSRLRAAVAALNGGKSARASFGLALATLSEPHWDALSPDAPLRHWRMVEPEPGGILTQAALRVDERILHFTTGVTAGDARLTGIASLMKPAAPVTAGAELPLTEGIARVLVAEGERLPVVVLRATDQDADARSEVAIAAIARAGRTVLWIAAHDLPPDAETQELLARHVDREALLSGAVPVLSIDGSAGQAAATSFAGRLRSALLWLGSPQEGLSAQPHGRRVLRFEMPLRDARQQRDMALSRWRRTASVTEADDNVSAALDRAASQFRLGPTAMETIVEKLRATAPADHAAAVWPAAREAARGGLDAIAQRIETRADFSDLVLPAGQSTMLRDIARQLRHRDRVYRDWGFGEKHRLGQGLVALFAGESGTGKTLAAEAIANEVELDLYRVDLATLVSKYIGETEKNLKRLFDAAETSGAVLLFDEADALFGKRSEVRDSHDRYANIEVAYLLQRIEAYRGLAVLTTNMKSALDRAFMRRIRFVVTFPFPDAAAREKIWRRQFPPNAPLGDIDFAALARLNLSGGHIRSVALNAAFKAADRGVDIDQGVLMEAAHEEFAKLERPMSAAKGSPR